MMAEDPDIAFLEELKELDAGELELEGLKDIIDAVEITGEAERGE